jgi:hypothetical protein
MRRLCLIIIGFVAVSALRAPAESYEFTTIAGFPGPLGGAADGTNSDARFDSPVALTVGPAQALYVADYFNNTIRRITPSGTNWIVSTIMGRAGVFGSLDGTNRDVLFNKPTGVAADAQGNLFIVDYFNHSIRKATSSGTNWLSSTIAGVAGNFGHDDGTNSSARFYFPRGIAVSGTGNIFVADLGNSVIRKISPAGTNWIATTIAGSITNAGSADGTNSDARFYWPAGICVTSNETLFVTDYANNTIRKIVPLGTNWIVTTIAGAAGSFGSTDGTNSDAHFNSPSSIALGQTGSLFVADYENDCIRKLTPSGTNWIVTTIGGKAGSSGSSDGTNETARFKNPQGIATDVAGNLFIADTGNNTIRRGLPVQSSTYIAPPPTIVSVSGGNGLISFTWNSSSGFSYQVQYVADLGQANWSNFASTRLATNSVMTATDSTSNSHRFYRVVLLP